MKFTATVDELRKAVVAATQVVSTKTGIPIMSNVHLAAADGEVCVVATDLDCEIRASLAAKTAVDGETTVPGRALAALLKGLPADADVLFDASGASDRGASVKAVARAATLPVLPAGDFPQISCAGDAAASISLAGRDMERLAALAAVCDDNPNRPYLSGANVLSRDGVLIAQASDGHCGARLFFDIPAKIDGATWIIPAFALALLPGLFPAGADLELRPGKASFRSASARLVTKLCEGAFPPADNIFTAEPSGLRITVDVAPFLTAVAAVLAISATQVVQIVAEGGRARILAGTVEGINAEDSVDADCEWSGVRSFTLGVAPLRDTLAAVGAETVRLSQEGSGTGVHVRSAAGPSDSIGIVMPYRGVRPEVYGEVAAAA